MARDRWIRVHEPIYCALDAYRAKQNLKTLGAAISDLLVKEDGATA